MKKLLVVLALFIGFTVANAQDKTKKDKKAKTEQKEDGPKLKKDGTPDKRFKDNKKSRRTIEKRWHARQKI
jgi:hypothetical protein